MFNNQRPRQVVIDEKTLNQLLEQAGMQPGNTAQYPLVPTQSNMPNEYQVIDEDSISDSEVQQLAPELDLNRNRNRVMRSTFGRE
jgi:hypothetical protein